MGTLTKQLLSRGHSAEITDWAVYKLREVAKVERGRFSHRPRNDPRFFGGDHPFIQTGDVVNGNGKIKSASQTLNDEGLKISKVFPKGTVMMAIAANIGDCSILTFDSACTDSVVGITSKNSVLDSDFLLSYFSTQKSVFTYVAPAGAQKNINVEFLDSLPLFLPPLPEQKKIAEILGACDEAIEAQERLIAQKQQCKKGLMQKLLTGEVRFPKFEGTAWREVAIGSLLKEVKRPVEWDDEEQYKLLSLRRRSGGPFARESLYGREIKTKTLKTVQTGDFLIAKMQVTHGALGMVTPEFDQYKVSASYICLVPRDEESFDIRFFNYLSQLRYIWHLAYVASYGVTIEKMTFVPKDFLKKKISVPSTKEECSAIAEFINSVNEELVLQESKLDQLKQQKKGLMQQLLTGKLRVKV